MAQRVELVDEPAADSAAARFGRDADARDPAHRHAPASEKDPERKQKRVTDDGVAARDHLQIAQGSERVVLEVSPPRRRAAGIGESSGVNDDEALEVSLGRGSQRELLHGLSFIQDDAAAANWAAPHLA